MYDKSCELCGQNFQTEKSYSMYCSSSCKVKAYNLRHGFKHRYRSERYTKICEYCCKVFQGPNGAKFCSRRCASESRRVFSSIPECLSGGHRSLDKYSGYVRVYVPMHAGANSRGYVYEHRVIAELKLGRPLNSSEHVHHKNGIRWDNHPDNLEVMTNSEHGKLTSSENKGEHSDDWVEETHSELIGAGLIKKKQNRVYRKAEKNRCVKCGAEITHGASHCVPCYKLDIRRIPDEVIQEGLEGGRTYSDLAREYGLSCVAVKKRAKRMGLKSHKENSGIDLAEVERLKEKGMSRRQIAKEIGVSISKLDYHIKTYLRAPSD